MTLKLISLQLLGIASAAIPSFHLTHGIRHVGCLCHHQPISLTGICTIWFRLTQASFDDVHILFLISTIYFHISFFPYSNHNQFLAQLGQKEKERLINYFLYSNFTYGLLLWDFTTCKWIKKIEKFRKEIASLY